MSADIPTLTIGDSVDMSIFQKTSGSRLDRLFAVFGRQRRFREIMRFYLSNEANFKESVDSIN